VKRGPRAIDPFAGVDATILRLQQMENWISCLRATAPLAVTKLGDLTRRMTPTAIGFTVDVTVEEWAAIAVEHQRRM
jgi:hypothetical protein